jgi:hypothetical protein
MPTTTSTTQQQRHRLGYTGASIALLMLLALILAACGSSPAATSSSTSSTSASGSSSNGSSQSGAVAFAQCVRSNGVPDFPDPNSNGQFLISGSDQNNANFQSAVQTCQHLLPGGSATNGGSGSNSSAELAFAHCMQTHGVPSFPDPSSNGALGIPAGVNANSPQFQKSFQECSKYLPNNGAGLGS